MDQLVVVTKNGPDCDMSPICRKSVLVPGVV